MTVPNGEKSHKNGFTLSGACSQLMNVLRLSEARAFLASVQVSPCQTNRGRGWHSTDGHTTAREPESNVSFAYFPPAMRQPENQAKNVNVSQNLLSCLPATRNS